MYLLYLNCQIHVTKMFNFIIIFLSRKRGGPFSREEDLLELEVKRAKLQIEVLNLEKQKLTKEIAKLEIERVNQTLLQQKLLIDLNEKGIVVQLN